MKKAELRLVLVTVLYGAFVGVVLILRRGFPGGVVPAIIASVIYITLMSVFLRRQTS
jgi:hypothetical protein